MLFLAQFLGFDEINSLTWKQHISWCNDECLEHTEHTDGQQRSGLWVVWKVLMDVLILSTVKAHYWNSLEVAEFKLTQLLFFLSEETTNVTITFKAYRRERLWTQAMFPFKCVRFEEICKSNIKCDLVCWQNEKWKSYLYVFQSINNCYICTQEDMTYENQEHNNISFLLKGHLCNFNKSICLPYWHAL